jgi:hypothetical protein
MSNISRKSFVVLGFPGLCVDVDIVPFLCEINQVPVRPFDLDCLLCVSTLGLAIVVLP